MSSIEVRCASCAQRMRLPAGRGTVLCTCPKCRTQIQADTGHVSPSPDVKATTEAAAVAPANEGGSWVSRFCFVIGALFGVVVAASGMVWAGLSGSQLFVSVVLLLIAWALVSGMIIPLTTGRGPLEAVAYGLSTFLLGACLAAPVYGFTAAGKPWYAKPWTLMLEQTPTAWQAALASLQDAQWVYSRAEPVPEFAKLGPTPSQVQPQPPAPVDVQYGVDAVLTTCSPDPIAIFEPLLPGAYSKARQSELRRRIQQEEAYVSCLRRAVDSHRDWARIKRRAASRQPELKDQHLRQLAQLEKQAGVIQVEIDKAAPAVAAHRTEYEAWANDDSAAMHALATVDLAHPCGDRPADERAVARLEQASSGRIRALRDDVSDWGRCLGDAFEVRRQAFNEALAKTNGGPKTERVSAEINALRAQLDEMADEMSEAKDLRNRLTRAGNRAIDRENGQRFADANPDGMTEKERWQRSQGIGGYEDCMATARTPAAQASCQSDYMSNQRAQAEYERERNARRAARERAQAISEASNDPSRESGSATESNGSSVGAGAVWLTGTDLSAEIEERERERARQLAGEESRQRLQAWLDQETQSCKAVRRPGGSACYQWQTLPTSSESFETRLVEVRARAEAETVAWNAGHGSTTCGPLPSSDPETETCWSVSELSAGAPSCTRKVDGDYTAGYCRVMTRWLCTLITATKMRGCVAVR